MQVLTSEFPVVDKSAVLEPEDDIFVLPTSFAQQRLWFLDLLAPNSCAYNLITAVRVRGALSVPVLELSVAEIVRRHEVLRTTFATVDGEARQIVRPASEIVVELIDLRQESEAEQERRVREEASREAQTPFDLRSGPLMRLTVLQQSESEHVLLLAMHHIISDGWSMGVLVNELVRLYGAYARGEESPLAELSIQYADYAIWQRERLQGEVLEEQLEYWRQQLSGAPAVLELPADRARPKVQSYRGATEVFTLSEELSERLKQVSREQGATLFITLLAAFQALLSRYGTDDVVVGSPIANRNRSEIEALIGFFVNTLVLRARVKRDESFTELVKQVREVCLGAYAHQDVPFEQLVEELQPERSLSYQPLCQVLFALQNAPHEARAVEGLRFEPVEFESRSCHCDLTVSMSEVNGRLQGLVEYSTDLFEAATITRMMCHFTNLLESIAADPEQRVGELRMLSAAEVAQVVDEWNETAREYPREACIHELFAAQARRRPEAVAVIADGEQVSYRELDQRANQVANHLQSLGVGPEVVVGICVERSVAMVVGLLGILKAGGAYLPLDAEYPQERLEYMLADAGVSVVLTEKELREYLESSAPTAETQTEVSSSNLAYVIYTSGSTGQPKGVAVPHRGVVRLVQESNYVKLDEEEVVLQMAPVSFDASTFEIWGALLNGARLVVMKAGQPSLAEIAETVEQHEVSTMWLTAGLFQVMAAEQLGSLREVKQLLAGGDVLSVRAVQAVLDGEGERVLINGYGPTENTTFSCCHVMQVGERVGESVSIGKPITNSTAYVLDEQLRPVPVGVRGELYLGGDGLARGYVRRAELTAEKFVPNPFSTVPGERLYRTGDVVRWNAEGVIEFIGRADQQVKVRGYRIELGEVEEALAGFEGISESAVVVRTEGESEKRLVGYVVARAELEVSELRAYLETKLPAYMIPSVFVELTELPLTANGKVDRNALAAADFAADFNNTAEYEAPRTEVEKLLAGIWAEVLGVERVGINDNFFELGGDSILSIQSIARANRNGLRLSPRDLFEHQTVAKLAVVAGTAAEVVAEQGLVTGPVALTPIQHWFFEQELSEPQYFNQTLLLEVRQAVDLEVLGEAVQRVVLQHDALRLRFERSESGWRQYHADAAEQASFSKIDLSAVGESEQRAAIEAEAAAVQASLNLAAGPLLRVVYFDLGAGRAGRLLLVCHHLVVDGVSWRILLADLQEAYRALAAGEEVQLPAKSSSFQQWSQALSEYAKSSAVQEQLDYWLRAEREHVRSIPRDYEGDNLVSSTAVVVESLGREETEALLQEVPGVYHTQINEVLLSGLALALGEWSASPVVLVDVEGHGREPISERVDVSRTVGWFTTIYPVLLEVDSCDELGEVVKQVKEQVRSIPGQGLGYGVLRYLGSEEVAKRLREMPQAEVSFNYLGQIDRVLNEETLFGAASESTGSYRSESGNRQYLVEINAMIVGGRLQVSWSYSRQVHQQETIAALAAGYVQSLRSIIEHCASEEAGGYTPSDFPLAQVSAAELAVVVGEQRRGIEDVYPLSPMQEGLLFHSLYAPQGGLYVEQVQNLFRGALDLAALRMAWERVQERHAILRSSFRWEGLRRPLQVVQQHAALTWEEQDWRGLNNADQAMKLEVFLSADRERGFELTQAPLMRMMVVRLGESEWQFVWSFHHILLDGWCISLLLQEVFQFYEGYRQGQVVELPRTRSYRDYIDWLQQQDLGAAESYWRRRLAGFQSPTQLAVGSADRSDETRSHGEQDLELSKEATKALETLARDQQVTLNTVVQGAWAVLLSQYSGERDVVYGVTVSGRPAELAGVEQMVGLFINTLPLRVQVESASELGSWLQRLQAEQAEMRQYEYSPLVEVQGWSEVERGVGLFETLVAFENYPVKPVAGEQSVSDSAVEYEQEWAMERTNYPLTLLIGPGEQLILRALYAEPRYDAETIKRVLGHLEQVLVSMADGAQQQVGDLRMLSADEHRQVVSEWNETKREYAREACIHELFAEQVRRRPEAVAVIADGERTTYSELDQRANQVAHRLQQLGVGPEVVVGICVERSVAMVVGLLGILKAGGAYLPLDAEYPQERLEYMLADAGVSVLLTQSELRERLPIGDGIECLEFSDWFASEAGEPESGATAETLAYVIYTSGSTGQPKGVAVPHRGVVRLVQESNYVKLDEEEVVLQMAPVSFDASTFEIWGALLNGARLVVMAAGQPSLAEIAETVKQHEVSTMWLTAGLFQVMAAEQLESLREVKQLLAGGDVLSVRAVQAVLEGEGERVLINGYGPTENTTFSCCHVMRAGEAVIGESVPIGKPITNSTAYVLDEQLRPVPVGVRGELYLGGDGLARGYVGRAAMTAERFVPNPYSAEPGARLYRTGDVVRWNAEGVIEFIGRADQQVKVRGFRIELGEVEEALAGYEGISESVVVVRTEGEGDKRLVGYVVARAELEVSELRAYLETKLPDYMIPSVFVELTELPLTANGKVDRKALAAAELEIEGTREYEAPRTEVERLLAGIWAEVLGVERVGIYDNFFELGGHSLLATQVISRVRETFTLELPLRNLFEAPQLSDFATTVEQAMRDEQPVEAPPLVPVSRDRLLPLSFAQQRLWFLDQLEPMSNAYNIPVVVRLHGPFIPEVFTNAVEEVIRRHESLRTRFVMDQGLASQQIDEAVALDIPLFDLTSLSADEQESEVRRMASEEARRPFDLAYGPLLRLTMLQLSETEHVLLATVHHIVSDGWSMSVLMRELTALYDAFSRGESSPLPGLAVQYADYAVWQREWLQGEVLERQMKYWREHLHGAPPVLELPTDHPRPAVPSLRGRMLKRRMSDELLQQLDQVGRQEGLTLYMSVLAAFVVVLARYSGEREIVVGTPIAGRTRHEIEGLIGFFVNTLVLRTRVDEQESVQQLFERVREVCLGAYTHQEVPFEQLVEELQPERDLSRQPLFQVMFALEDGGDEQKWQGGELQVEVDGVESEVAKFDLTLRVLPAKAGCELSIEYQQDLFEEATIARMLEHVERVLEAMVGDVLQPVSELPLLTAAEREQLLEQWNATAREYADDVCVQQVFEARVAERPDAVALVCEGERLSYGELNRRSNQLAHYLRELGVGPEVVVGLCMDRSVEMVVGLLGILKAGGAYLPLDPTYPQQRISFMLDDAAPSILLSKESLLPSLPFSAARVLCLDADQHLFFNHSDENPDANVNPLNLAYVIYTSGSTGTPKGVQIQHRSLVNFLNSMQREPGLTANDYLLAVTSLSFDIAALEIFLPFTCGAQVEVVSREMAAQGALLKDRLIASQATVMQATPATWRLLAGAGLDGLDRLQRWCGGEALNRELANQLANDHAVVWNLYGPTETTIWSGLWKVPAGSDSVLIGKPIANTQFYVLDEHFRPTPVGVPGELYIGGDGVARGYMNRPELTAERFVPDPFNTGARLYRTGDTVRWKAEGELEFLERRDQQVKVRGYRIELGEIEAVLNEHPSVKESVAAVKDDADGNKRLVAYVVEEAGSEVSASELRQTVREKLPEYMVPAQLIKLESIPLTPNGKVDRKRLPDVEGTALVVNEYVAPRSATEASLAEIWQRVLLVERVGINDNFFELGGDSIVSIQIIAQAKELGLQFTPKDLFQHQTIATLLEAIGSSAIIGAEQGVVMGQVSLTPIQHWFFEQQLNEPNHFNQSVLLELTQAVDPHLLAEAARQLVLHHDALRLRFEQTEAGWNQYHADAAEPVSFAIFDLSTVPAGEQSAAIEAEVAAVHASLNVTDGPLVRFVYFDLGESQPARLLVVCHHLVIDGVSWRILLEDLQRACDALLAGEAVQLPAKSTSYQQWSEAIAVYAASSTLEQQLTYWLSAEREQVMPLPRDYDDGQNRICDTALVAVGLTREETEALLQEVPGVYHTQINEVLLSALAIALGQWTGQQVVLVDVEGHGREAISEHTDVSRTVGWFTTIYPVLLEVKGRLTAVGEVVKQVKEQVRAIPEQGMGYGMLRYLGQASVRLQQLPQAEVVFNYTGQFDQTLSESGLFRLGREDRGEGRSAANQRAHLLEVTGGVAGGQLQMTWSYSEQVHKRETVERVAADFIEALREMVQQCQWGEVVSFTPSDFPEARLSQKDLDKFLTRINEGARI